MGVLHRLTTHPFGYQQWRDYHQRFRARYGVGALVPVMDLVADSGLGLPAEFLGSARGRAARQLTDRDEKVLALLQQASLEGAEEIVLTEALIADLQTDSDGEILPAPWAEVSFEIRAPSPDAVAAGAFGIALTGIPRPGSSMAGRFAHLLPAEDQAALTTAYAATEPGTIAAQLSFPPRRRRNENIARTPQLLPYVISLAEHRLPSENVIALADLAVTADTRAFHLVQLSTGRRIEPRVLHALEAGTHTPPLARFLAEVTTAHCAVHKGFDFGAAARLPYLPRVRYRRTILTPARWLLQADDLPSRTATTADWESGLRAWRTRLRAPERIVLVEQDQRLPLDLTHPVHRVLLRTRLDGARRLELRETSDPAGRAWIGRPHELLLLLALDPPRPAHYVPSATAPTTRSAHLPGTGPLLHARLHAHPDRYDEILTEHLPRLLQAFASPQPRWWFRRYCETTQPDGVPGLALYLELPNIDGYGQAAELLRDWSEGLRRGHMLAQLDLATYEPQSGLFGHGPAIEAAHALFATDSTAALAQIRMARRSGTPSQALTAASLVDLAAGLAGTASAGCAWLVEHLPHEHGPLDRALRDHALDLTASRGPLESRPAGAEVVVAWHDRGVALAAYRQALAGQRDPLTVLPSLLRQHHARALGIDPADERITHRLARTCALRHIATTRPR